MGRGKALACWSFLLPMDHTAPTKPEPTPASSSSLSGARPGSAIRPLTQQEKDRLNTKYGQINKPTAAEVAQVAQSGCKMQ